MDKSLQIVEKLYRGCISVNGNIAAVDSPLTNQVNTVTFFASLNFCSPSPFMIKSHAKQFEPVRISTRLTLLWNTQHLTCTTDILKYIKYNQGSPDAVVTSTNHPLIVLGMLATFLPL